MGVLDQVRKRNAWQITRPHDGNHDHDDDDKKSHVGEYATDTDSDTLSLEAQNEKEVQAHPESITTNAQYGVQKAEAAAIVWSRKALVLTYAWIWVCFFMLAFQQAILSYASITAYSKFIAAPAYTTAGILAIIIGGVLKLPIAKVLNIWGRAEGFLIFVVVYVMGIIILAAASGPNTYAAGYVFYWVGYDSLYIILDVFIADTSGLRNRAFAWAFAATPFICTAFTGPLAAQSFINHTGGWRWAIGTFAIVQPFVFCPLAVVFKFYQRKAEKMGVFRHEPSGRTTWKSCVHYFHEFDVIGMFILMAAFVLFLLPFSLESYGRAPYNSGTFIAMLVVGVLLFPVFFIWEKYFARTHFMRWELLQDRTVLGACTLSATLYLSFYCWDTYYYNYVKVVYALSISYAGYMTQIYNVGSCFFGVVFGVWVHYTKHFKHFCLFFGLPLFTLGAGLMIYFRGSDKAIGYLIMCQIFIAFGGGTLVIGQQMAVMAAADRDGVPMLLALLYLASDVGGAIGTAIVSAIYANTFPKALSSKLPASDQNLVQTLYLGGYTVQEEYVPGTPIRTAINYALGRTQFYGCIAATAVMVLGFIGCAAWKNYNVDKKQNKGTIL